MPSMDELMTDPTLRDLYVYFHLLLNLCSHQGIVPANSLRVVVNDETLREDLGSRFVVGSNYSKS